jgi:hypothetical protein
MKSTKWCLALVALLYLAPATFAIQNGVNPRHFDPKQNWSTQTAPLVQTIQKVPEGGSSLVYLLGAGVICMGAILSRFRVADPSVSDGASL